MLRYHTFFKQYTGTTAQEIVEAVYADSKAGMDISFHEWQDYQNTVWMQKYNRVVPALDTPDAYNELLHLWTDIGALESSGTEVKTRRSSFASNVISDPREHMANQLLMRGHAALKEVLTCSFGEWPPQGMHIRSTAHHDRPVFFKPIVEKFKQSEKKNIFFECWNMLHTPFEKEPDIHKLLCCTLPQMILGAGAVNTALKKEALHVLQGDDHYKADNILGVQKTEKPSSYTRLRDAFNTAVYGARNYLAYLKKGIELQVRMHHLMMDGYPRWGKMPETREEFLAAMHNAGALPPAEMLQQIKEAPSNRLHHFLGERPGITEAAQNLHIIGESLQKPQRNLFWQQTLPAIYADILEMVGDALGRQKFGFGINPKNPTQRVAFKKPTLGGVS